MAQISVSDESYQKIEEMAQERQITPEQLIDLAIEHLIQLEIERERAEYGDAFIEEMRQQANTPRPPETIFYESTEEFLQAIHDAPYAAKTDYKSFAGVMADLPHDFLDELDHLRHSVLPTPPIEDL